MDHRDSAPIHNPQFEARQHWISWGRIDQPDLRYGNLVWWKGECHKIEAVERQGSEWIAVLVTPGDMGRKSADCWFVPVSRLKLTPSF